MTTCLAHPNVPAYDYAILTMDETEWNKPAPSFRIPVCPTCLRNLIHNPLRFSIPWLETIPPETHAKALI